MQFELIHYLLIALIWVGVFNLCYMLLRDQDKKEVKTRRHVEHKAQRKKGEFDDPFYNDLFEGGESYE